MENTATHICMHCGKVVPHTEIRYFAYRPICQDCYRELVRKQDIQKLKKLLQQETPQ